MIAMISLPKYKSPTQGISNSTHHWVNTKAREIKLNAGLFSQTDRQILMRTAHDSRKLPMLSFPLHD